MEQLSLDIVYVLTNAAMPGLVKLGKTSHDDPEIRLSQLYSTGVPVPFSIEFACRVPNAHEVERALHTAFAPQRINPRREFFEIEPEQAIAIMKLLHHEELSIDTVADDAGIDDAEKQSGEKLRKRRPSINFDDMNIPVGSRIDFNQTDDFAIVSSPKRIRFREDESTSLTAATRELLGLDYNVQPTRYWSFRGKNLREIWDETYGTVD